MSEPERRPAAVPLGAGGMWVPAEAAGELAQALALYRDLLQGRRPPAEVRLPRPTRTIEDLRAVAARVAQEHERAKHRAAAQAALLASADGNLFAEPLFPPAETVGPSQPATMTVSQAAIRLRVTERRVRQLAETGRIRATRGARNVWELSGSSVAQFEQRRREQDSGDGSRDAGTPGHDGTAHRGARGGEAAA